MTYTSVQPDEDLFFGIWIRRGEEPEKQIIPICVCRHWNRASIALTNVEVYIRNAAAVDGELCKSSRMLEQYLSFVHNTQHR